MGRPGAYAARRTYRWWRPPTSRSGTTRPAAGPSIGLPGARPCRARDAFVCGDSTRSTRSGCDGGGVRSERAHTLSRIWLFAFRGRRGARPTTAGAGPGRRFGHRPRPLASSRQSRRITDLGPSFRSVFNRIPFSSLWLDGQLALPSSQSRGRDASSPYPQILLGNRMSMCCARAKSRSTSVSGAEVRENT